MEDNNIDSLTKEALSDISKADSIDKLNDVKNKYLSKKGSISSLMLKMKELTI